MDFYFWIFTKENGNSNLPSHQSKFTFILKIYSVFSFIILVLGTSNCSFTQPRNYICYRTLNPIKIDGKADEFDWNNAPWTESFVDIEGDSKPLPRLQTRAKMLWDKDYFYFFAKLEEPHIWATLTERDAVIYYDDDFEIFIDPDGDGHNYYEFEINAFNTLWDLFLLYPYHLKKDPNYLFNWTIPNIKTAVHVEGTVNNPDDQDQFWSVEFAIPWSSLKEMAAADRPPRSGEQWRVNFSRVDWEMEISNEQYVKKRDPKSEKILPENNWVWSPTGRIDMHRPEKWGFVQFSEKIVGNGTDIFIENPDKPIIDALWNLYYQQRRFFRTNGFYSKDLTEFDVPQLSDCSFAPTIYTTPNLFEITAHSCDKNRMWFINQDAKIERIIIKN